MRGTLLEKAKKLYTYAYPIVLSDYISRGPKEEFLHLNHMRRFMTPEDGSVVVRPNNDTLYSGGWMRLKDSPYILEIPPVTDRYLLVDALNMKTEVICSIGTRTGEIHGGKYIFLYGEEAVPEGYEEYTVIRSEDSRNMFVIRLESFGTEDYEKANRWQDQVSYGPVYPEKIQDNGEKLYTPSVRAVESLSVEEFYRRFTSTFIDTRIDTEILELLKEFGIGKERYEFSSLSIEAKAALMKGANEAYKELKEYQGTEGYESNGFRTFLRGMGVYGKNYLFRAHVAWFGYGANLAEDSVYPMAFADSKGELLNSTSRYKLHFKADNLPHAEFFWSVTLYGEPSQGLSENPINRYLINSHVQDRLYFNEDGSLDIVLSQTPPEDEKYKDNWLPTPTEENRFSLTMRIYGPDEETLQGKWEAPVVEKIGEGRESRKERGKRRNDYAGSKHFNQTDFIELQY